MGRGFRPPTEWCLCISLALSGHAFAGECSLDSQSLERGEQKPFLFCGERLAPDTEFRGLADAGIEVLSSQSLRRCAVGDRRPGFYLILRAGADAQTAAIELRDRETRESLCGRLHLRVPERVLLPKTNLAPVARGGIFRLRLTAPRGVDFSEACADALEFPAGEGFGIAVVEDRQPVCTSESIEALVRIREGRQAPAGVVIPALNAIAWVEPPPPAFLGAMAEADARFVDVDGVRTRYFEQGHGEVLILVHGGQPSAPDFNAWEWQQNFAGFAENYRVIALDRIGQGGTDNPADLDDYAEYYSLVVAHLYGFIRALGLERVHLVGHSQGGWPVARLAIDHPELVATLVIVDSTMVAPTANVAQAVRFYLYQQNDLHPSAGETPESIRRGMSMFSYTHNNITDQRVQRIHALAQTDKFAAARDWFATTSMSPAHPSYRALKSSIWQDLSSGRLKVPTLIIWGRQDPEGSFDAGVEFYEALARAGSDANFHAFDRAGHVPYMEYPEEFNRVVHQFIISRQ